MPRAASNDATGSTAAATATSTGPSTSSPCNGCATIRRPPPTTNGSSRRARRPARRADVSSARSLATSTTAYSRYRRSLDNIEASVGGLPSGTVTFLFTDVEGSTGLLRKFGEIAYADELAAHRRVLREACERHGGVEVDTQGDAFFVAFASARDAASAAACAQEALAE